MFTTASCLSVCNSIQPFQSFHMQENSFFTIVKNKHNIVPLGDPSYPESFISDFVA